MSTTFVILPQAVRGDLSYGHAGDPSPTPLSVAAGDPNTFSVTFPSTDWTNLAKVGTLTMSTSLQKSIDGGVTWTDYGGFGGGINFVGKQGTIDLAAFSVYWDGQPMLLRGIVDVGAPFSWGISLVVGDLNS